MSGLYEIVLTIYHMLPYNFIYNNFGGSQMDDCNRVINSLISNVAIFAASFGLLIIMRTVVVGNALNL